jgi:hypothetical protein
MGKQDTGGVASTDRKWKGCRKAGHGDGKALVLGDSNVGAEK